MPITYKPPILPDSRVMVYRPEAKDYEPAIVLMRYGYKSELMKREFGEEAARYPDLLDVRFEKDGVVSLAHFTECAIPI